MKYVNLIRSLHKKNKYIIKSELGFSLVELLVAMLILMLIVFAFTPLLVSSIGRIRYAGDKSDALYQGQSEVEVSIAERITEGTTTLTFDFNDSKIIVSGGLVDVLKEEGQASAWLSGFVPSVPSINLFLSPLPLVEGYDEIDIIVMGRDTSDHFDLSGADNNTVTIYDKHGFKAQEPILAIVAENQLENYYLNIPGDYTQYAVFNLSEGLKNSLNPYMPTVKWFLNNGDSDIEVFVQTSLQVVLPYAVAVGDGQRIWVSPDADETWKSRSNVALGTGTINDVVWTGFQYAAVSSNGRIIIWNNNEEPKLSDQSFNGLNAITYGNGQLVAVSNTGQIVNSFDGVQWTVNENTGKELNTIGWNDLIFMAAGTSGEIWTSSNGESWIKEIPPDAGNVTFNGVAGNGSTWLAVGYESSIAVIYKYSDGSWEKSTTDLPPLNDIIYDGSRFVAVGDGGTIVTSSDGSSWVEIKENNSNLATNNLNAISLGNRVNNTLHYVIVGDSGTIINGNAEDDWEVLTDVDIGDHSIKGVAIR